MRLPHFVIYLALPVTAAGQAPVPPPDTMRIEVGSPALDGRVYKPHAARVRVRLGDSSRVTSTWTNELTVGDSAGRTVMHWVTKGTQYPAGGREVTWELRQTYDARTLAPIRYSQTSSAGGFQHLTITDRRVRGTKRVAGDSAVQQVDVTLDRPGFFAGASDLVPLAVGLKEGAVMTAPVWSPAMTKAEGRIFSVLGKATVDVEGTSIEAWKVEERRESDRVLLATWYLLDKSPYMVYGEVALPNGQVRKMTEAAIGPRPAARDIARAVDSLAAQIVASGVTPGLGVAVVMDGSTVLAKGYGWADAGGKVPADERTYWYVASTSKSYTGFGIALLVNQRVISLATPITTLLPGVRWPDGIDATRLTLAHFLSHTHHLNDDAVVQSAAYTGAFPESEWPNLIRFARPSGNDDLVYSNFGYNVAAMVIDRVRPEGWRRYLDSAVYRPAGMRDTYARVSGLDPRRIAKPHAIGGTGEFLTLKFQKTDVTMNSAGGHLATVGDLARWVIVHMDSGRIDGRQVFPRDVVAQSHRILARQTVDSRQRFGPFDREAWASGWDIGTYRGEPMVSRFGGYVTFRSHLSMLPARRIGVVAQTNGVGAGSVTDLIAAFAYDLEAGRPDARAVAAARLDSAMGRLPRLRGQSARSESQRAARQEPLRRPLSDFAGSYVNEMYGTLEFTVTDGALRYRWGVLEGPTEVLNAGADQLRVEIIEDGRQTTFDFAGAGPARSVELGNIRFVRRAP